MLYGCKCLCCNSMCSSVLSELDCLSLDHEENPRGKLVSHAGSVGLHKTCKMIFWCSGISQQNHCQEQKEYQALLFPSSTSRLFPYASILLAFPLLSHHLSPGAVPDFPRTPCIWSFLGTTHDRTVQQATRNKGSWFLQQPAEVQYSPSGKGGAVGQRGC